jgi:hypothetical protein
MAGVVEETTFIIEAEIPKLVEAVHTSLPEARRVD